MSNQKPRYIKPGEESLYPRRSVAGVETLLSPDTDSALAADADARSAFTYNRLHHLPLDAQRQRLPVFQHRSHILYLLERHQTLLLVGETGCGKSTQVPQYLLEIGHKVCVTQPRVSAAVTLAERVARERGQLLGEDVGYAAGMTAERSARTGIVFMTEGVLLREMFASPLLMQYTCIVLDEVHERTLMTDVLMGLLKKIAKKRKNLKLVISSATMDAEFLKDLFNLSATDRRTDRRTVRRTDKRSTSVVLSIHGRTHPVQVLYSAEPVADYVSATVQTAIRIHENEPFGDVLAFLTSQEEISEALEALQTYAAENNLANKQRRHFPSGVRCSDLLVLPMYGTLPHHAQIKVFQTADSNVRKIVVASNIAETSVTIPGVVYVIDCGFHKLPYFSPRVGVQSVAITPISKANAIQRAGRAGRTHSGKCYRLYPESAYEALSASSPPEMCRSDLAYMLLVLKALGISNVLRFTFPTPPPAKCLLSALETLYALGAIDEDGALTEVTGTNMAELPLKPMISKMLCSSGEWGCIEEMLCCAAMLQVDNVFTKGWGKEAAAAAVSRRNHFEVAEGDIIMYLNIMDAYLRVRETHGDGHNKKGKEWCRSKFLNYRVMEKACEIRSSLEKLVKGKFNLVNREYGADMGSGRTERVVKCILSGLFPTAARLTPAGHYSGARGGALHIAPDSCLYRLQQPQWVVFASVQSSHEKTYMRQVTPVRRDWLMEVAQHYYVEV